MVFCFFIGYYRFFFVFNILLSLCGLGVIFRVCSVQRMYKFIIMIVFFCLVYVFFYFFGGLVLFFLFWLVVIVFYLFVFWLVIQRYFFVRKYCLLYFVFNFVFIKDVVLVIWWGSIFCLWVVVGGGLFICQCIGQFIFIQIYNFFVFFVSLRFCGFFFYLVVFVD